MLNEELLKQTVKLKTDVETAPQSASLEEQLSYYDQVVSADTAAAGQTVSRLESIIDAKYWPYPTFEKLLFSV